MKQTSLAMDLSCRRTRKRVLLDEMEQVVPWAQLLALIEPHAPVAKTGRPPFALSAMLRIHFLQQWFGLSDMAMEEALFDVPMYRDFAGFEAMAPLPDRVSILRFRHLLEEHRLAEQFLKTVNELLAAKGYLLKEGSAIDASLIAAPSSTKNSSGQRDPEMRQSKKGQQWHFGMKAHIGVDADSGLVHTVVGTAGHVHDVTQAGQLLHGQESEVFTDAGYQGVEKRPETQGLEVNWQVALRPGKRKALDKSSEVGRLVDQLETTKARIRAKVEHPFRVIKRQFGYMKVRYKGLMKNTQQLITLFTLSNLWMVRKRILQAAQG